MAILHRLYADERGATAVEYSLIVALIAVAIIVALGAVGDQFAATLDNVEGTLSFANS